MLFYVLRKNKEGKIYFSKSFDLTHLEKYNFACICGAYIVQSFYGC